MKINQKKSSSNSKTSESCATNNIHASSVDSNINSSSKVSNKRHLSADGLSLLPSALRSRLLDLRGMITRWFKSSKICLGMISKHKNSSKILVVMIFTILLSSFICLGMINSKVSAASMTLTIPDSPVTLNLTPSSSEAAFAKSSGSTVSVKSDASFGYTLTVQGKSSDNSLVNGSNKVSSIPGSITENDFKTNTSYNNKWGYSPSKLYNADSQTTVSNTNFLPGPTSTVTDTIDKTTSPNSESSNEYNITIAAKVDNAIASGKYSNNFTFSAIANSVNYSIHYNLNSGSGGPTINPQTGSTTEASIALDSATPTREGYTFEGWCDQETSDESCNGATYEAGASYPLVNGANNIELYAKWKSSGPTTMQGFGSYCSSMTEHQQLTLTDTRDNTKYTVAKLKDGKCWMIENLKITDKTLTSADSDVASNFILPASSTSGFSDHDAANVYVDNTWGGYYTWYAATAGEGTESMSSGSASYSICPKGWRLPTGGSSGEFQALVTAYGGTASGIMATPIPGFTLAGRHNNDGGTYVQGGSGLYWSSTLHGSGYPYVLYFMPSHVNPAYYYVERFYGFPVRCVAR